MYELNNFNNGGHAHVLLKDKHHNLEVNITNNFQVDGVVVRWTSPSATEERLSKKSRF